ncbi:MAG: putative capsular polysaccharide synthesis family protein [Flavobacteriaceae bacterium]|nr:putative capsular polysaccharide synthesis family protein [Flavobacteriaceae bacterium]
MNKRIKEKLRNSWARIVGFYFLDIFNYLRYRFFKKDIVFVYQMGKVASSSIYYSLKEKKKVVYHVHRLNEKHIRELHKVQLENTGLIESKAVDERGIRLYNIFIKNNKRPVYIISLARNPIERNMSAFFQNKEYYTKQHSYFDTDKLTNLFYNKYDHDTPLMWFDREFKHCLNIDIYDSPFPKEKKYKILKSENLNILLMRVDLEDSIKENIISDFLGIKNFKLKNKNVGTLKSYNEEYKEFKRIIKLNESYINRMLNSKYANYFYTNEEINEIKKKWLKNI